MLFPLQNRFGMEIRMRKQNAEFLAAFTSEAASDLKNTDYFGYVELDDFACYVIADGIDDQLEAMSAKLTVDTVVTVFSEAPSMSRRMMKKCLKAANRALLEARSKTTLKASVIIVLTDYVKLRYGQAGNIRLRLYRNGFIKEETIDQSLSTDMVHEEMLPKDKVASHEERNNLYTYLGQKSDFHPHISKKIKLTNADAVALYTRDIWEHIDEGEMKDVFADASDKPQELVDTVEDLLMSRQPQDFGKYTFAVIFVNKIFTDPNRKRKIKRIMVIAAAVLSVLITAGIFLYVRYQKRQDKIAAMQKGYTDTIEYIQMDHYNRAKEVCKEAQTLAGELKDDKMQTELGNCLKLVEAVLAAQESLDNGAYQEAQKGFGEALIRSRYADHLGEDYIEERLAMTADYLSVYDYIYLGDTLAENLQYENAEEKYLEAKALATKLYFDEGRTEAIRSLEKLYEEQKAEKAAEDEEMKNKLARETSAANYFAEGDAAYAQGDYESAKVFYQSAMQTYEALGDEAQQGMAREKIAAAEKKIQSFTAQGEEAASYIVQAQACETAGDYAGAKKYYLLAKDIYARQKDEAKLGEVERKIEAAGIKEQQQQQTATAP